MVNHQADFTKIIHPMSGAVTVVVLLFSFVSNPNGTKDRWFASGVRCLVFVFQVLGEGADFHFPCL